MEIKIKKWLYDGLEASHAILAFCKNKTFSEYQDSLLLKSAVERQFEILGESLRRVREIDPQLIDSIKGSREAITFRNILAHEYSHIDDSIVWSIIDSDLLELQENIQRHLSQ